MARCHKWLHQPGDLQVLMTSMYYDNWITVFPFIPQKDGSAAFCINAGTGQHAAHDVADIGASAAGDTDQAACTHLQSVHCPDADVHVGHAISHDLVCSLQTPC